MEELKPCPFCGGEAKVEISLGRYSVICTNCDATILPSTTLNNPTKDDVIANWNRRTEKQCALSEICRLYAEQED